MVTKNSHTTETLGRKSLRGAKWNILYHGFEKCFGFAIGIVLARLLDPRAFGLVGMVGVLIGFAHLLRGFGFSAALVHLPNVGRREISTIFWFNVLMGSCFTLLFVISAPAIARFYSVPQLRWIASVMALDFLFGALLSFYTSFFQRKLEFGFTTLVQIVAKACSGIVAVVLAMQGFGAWALVISSLVSSIIGVLLFGILVKWRPSFMFCWRTLRHCLKFGANFTGQRVCAYWIRNAGSLFIGRMLGESSLGVYRKAQATSVLVCGGVVAPVWGVLFPALSRAQGDKKASQRLYLKASRWVSLVTFPAALGLAVVAEPFIIGVYGEPWAGVVPLLPLFVLAGLCRAIPMLSESVFLAQGRPDLGFRMTFIDGVGSLAAFWFGLQANGLPGLVSAYLLWSLVWVIPSIHVPAKLIGLSWLSQVRNLASVLASSVLMAGIVYCVDLYMAHAGFACLSRLFALVPAGGLFYVSFLTLFKVKEWLEIKCKIEHGLVGLFGRSGA